jgi:hypothetical protein
MRTRLLAAILVLAALPLYGSIRATLDAPRAGSVLRGGTTATIAWSATGLPAKAEEWEAFLSVDGGAFYAYRITPHLDLDRQHFTFEVPNVATRDARILLRVGDEREEHELEFGATFVIEADALLALAEPPKKIDDGARGEPARPGDRGVVAWVDGDRNGRHVATRSAARDAHGLDDAQHAIETFEIAEAASPLPLNAPRSTALALFLARRVLHRDVVPMPRIGRRVLLLGSRLNI